MRISILKEIELYVTKSGEKPFIKWLEALKDSSVRFRIKERLDRLALGNMGDHKYLSDGISELRLDFGAGYRIYFGEVREKIVLLLCGGDKSTQRKDIKSAVMYWKDYQTR